MNFQNHCMRIPCYRRNLPTPQSLSRPAISLADGDTALILAAWHGHVDITKVLLKAGADVDMTNCDGNCALNQLLPRLPRGHAVAHRRGLYDRRARQCDRQDRADQAAYAGHADVAEVLLRAGADRNAMVRAAPPNKILASLPPPPRCRTTKATSSRLRLVQPPWRFRTSSAPRPKRTGRIRHYPTHPLCSTRLCGCCRDAPQGRRKAGPDGHGG